MTKQWPGAPDPVLDHVDLRVEAGTATRIGGQNGAGKTTLLRIACGLITPEEGTVRLAGLDPRSDRRAFQSAIGFLSAGNSGLYARLTVAQHLDYWARLAFLPRASSARAIADALVTFALDDLKTRRVDRLSMGQRQRLRLAVSFLHVPKLVLLDEPDNSLDDEGVALLARAVKDLTARGGSAVVCSPLEAAGGLSFDRSFTILDGRLEPA